MGKRLHVAKVYQVEYAGGHEHFNYKIEEFHNLLDALHIVYYPDDDCFSEDIEVSKIQWRRGIKKLQQLDTLPTEEQESINEALRQLETTVSEAISIMKEYLEESDPDNEVLFLSFF